ncbi:MAG: HEAT repeat domain-containing protein [Desulfocapsaceae bacterium]
MSSKHPTKIGADRIMTEVSDAQLLKVIKDFLEMGHADNIVAMFDRDSRYFDWTGAILDDERFAVRLGVSVLFEELRERKCTTMHLAVPSLTRLLTSEKPLLRGEALSVLAIINDQGLRGQAARMLDDADLQVQEIARDILESL